MLPAHVFKCTCAFLFIGSHCFACHSLSFCLVRLKSLCCCNLGGKRCPQFDSVLYSGVWIRVKLKQWREMVVVKVATLEGRECFAILFRDTILRHEKQSNFLVVSEKSSSSFVS